MQQTSWDATLTANPQPATEQQTTLHAMQPKARPLPPPSHTAKLFLVDSQVMCRYGQVLNACDAADEPHCWFERKAPEQRRFKIKLVSGSAENVACDPRGGVYSFHAWPQSCGHKPSHPFNDGTEHVGFSRTRQTSGVPSAICREVFGESHEG